MTNTKNNTEVDRDQDIISNESNDQNYFNSTQEQSKQSINEAIEESKRSIDRNFNEVQNQIPRYVQEIVDSQEQITQANREICENFLEYNKQAISSFQSVFVPYFENIHNQYWNNQKILRSGPELYSRVLSNLTENTIDMSRVFNDTMFSNIRLFRKTINKAKGYCSHLAEIGKRNAQAYEGISRAASTATASDTITKESDLSLSNSNNNNRTSQ